MNGKERVVAPGHCLERYNSIPQLTEECKIDCETGCAVSAWSSWSSCHPARSEDRRNTEMSVRTRKLLYLHIMGAGTLFSPNSKFHLKNKKTLPFLIVGYLNRKGSPSYDNYVYEHIKPNKFRKCLPFVGLTVTVKLLLKKTCFEKPRKSCHPLLLAFITEPWLLFQVRSAKTVLRKRSWRNLESATIIHTTCSQRTHGLPASLKMQQVSAPMDSLMTHCVALVGNISEESV